MRTSSARLLVARRCGNDKAIASSRLSFAIVVIGTDIAQSHAVHRYDTLVLDALDPARDTAAWESDSATSPITIGEDISLHHLQPRTTQPSCVARLFGSRNSSQPPSRQTIFSSSLLPFVVDQIIVSRQRAIRRSWASLPGRTSLCLALSAEWATHS